MTEQAEDHDNIIETSPGRFQFRPPYEPVDTPQLVRPPQPKREMAVHHGSLDDAAEHQRRAWVLNQDSQLAEAYHYRKQTTAQQQRKTQDAQDQASLEQSRLAQMTTERDQALARWSRFRQENSDVIAEPVNA